MKTRRCAALLLTLLLTGCAEAKIPAAAPLDAPPPPAAQVEVTPTQPPETLSASQMEAQARPLTDEEVLAAYERAVETYSWFDLCALPTGSGTATVDGWGYGEVDYPGIGNLDDLRGYLSGLFSAELTEKLMATGGEHRLYVDVDGALYTTAGARGADVYKGAVTKQVAQTGDTQYSVNVTVETLDADLETVTGVECWSFPYELTGDRWVFTSFDLVY